MTPLGETKVREVEWAGDDHIVIITSAPVALEGVAMQEMAGAVDIDLNTRKSFTLLGGSKSYLDAIFGWYGAANIDGVWHPFVGGVSTDRMGNPRADGIVLPSLYRINLVTGEPKLIGTPGPGSTRWVIGPDGSVVGRSSNGATGRETSLYAGAGQDQLIFKRPAGQGGDWLAGLGRTPGTLAVAARHGADQTLREYRLGGPVEGELLFDGVDADNSVSDRKTGLFLGVTRPAGERMVDPGLQIRLDAAHKAFPGERSALAAYSSGLDRLVMYTDGPASSGTYWLVDIAKKTAVPIGNARPEIKASDVAPMRMVNFKAGDGLAMNGLLTLPVGRAPTGLPLVVIPHGGPLTAGDTPQFYWLAQAFASRGYAVFQPNYRGTEGYGAAFRSAAAGQMGRRMQSDLSDGVTELVQQGLVDQGRVCIVGTGNGGYAAQAGVTLQHGIYRCAVSVGGMSDFKAFLNLARMRTADSRLSDYWRQLAPSQDDQGFTEVSPLSHAGEADAPILLIHGRKDVGVPISQGQAMDKALRLAGKVVEFMALDDVDSSLTQESGRQIMLARTMAFVEKYNPPK